MNSFYTILTVIGSIFILIGAVITIVFMAVFGMDIVAISIPSLFVILGLAMVIVVWSMKNKQKMIVKKGKRYPAKIYKYVQDTSILVNGSYTMNVVVHYFDEYGVEKEATLPTQFSKGSNMYAIGMTIDIFEYQGKYGYDINSLRNETLVREQELMDDIPIVPNAVQVVGMHCPNCGASFKAKKGYANKCPYCGSYLNA